MMGGNGECMHSYKGCSCPGLMGLHAHIHLFTTGQSLVKKWEEEKKESVDKEAYPMWAETLLKDEALLLRYCGKE